MSRVTKGSGWAVNAFDECQHYSECYGIGGDVGIVRCPDGDTERFEYGAAFVRNCLSLGDQPVEPPRWGWWRWNPDPSGEYSVILADASGPGPGNWRGAQIITAAYPADPTPAPTA